jgi:hypothetical protein
MLEKNRGTFMQQMMLWPTEEHGGDALICGQYRYRLQRWWGPDQRTLLWIMLNPSWADSQENDATLRRLISFSKREGYSRLEVVNLFALINSDSSALCRVENPTGPENNSHIKEAILRADRIIVAWGNPPFRPRHRLWSRDREVLDLLSPRDLWCFGTTKSGRPLHPLYLGCDRALEPFHYPTHQ